MHKYCIVKIRVCVFTKSESYNVNLITGSVLHSYIHLEIYNVHLGAGSRISKS
jgi:hypothetical protein